MKNVSKEVSSISIEEELKRSYLDYAMSVIVGRALPDVRDGLKPVHRRVLYAMKKLGNDYNSPYKKSARIVGDVIGKYHPHGDGSVYDAIVRLAQPFSMRYALIDGQGNFGSIDGDSAAAMRYTEIRMSKIAQEILEDLEKNTVDFVPNYDGNEKIPDVMPTKIPNLLINGSSGIAVGMTTNIPPHNIVEVIDACLAYINDNDIQTEELVKYIRGPDFPTAAIIYEKKEQIVHAYRTGKGTIQVRALTEIENDKKNNRTSIIIREIPYQINKIRLIEKIVELVKERKIDGIHEVRDESDKDGMRVVIELKRESEANFVLNSLYALTRLQTSININMIALLKGKPTLLNLKKIISSFIDYRKEIVIKRTIFELNQAKKRVLSLEAMIISLKNIDFIISLIKGASTPKEARLRLTSFCWKLEETLIELDRFYSKKKDWKNCFENHLDRFQKSNYRFNEEQAQTILDLKLQKLTNLEKEKVFEEYISLTKEITSLVQILQNSNRLMEIIKNELIYIKNQYRDKRRTKIIEDNSKFNQEDLIKKKKVIVILSNQGYIKFQSISDYDIQKRGGKGKSSTRLKEKDFVKSVLVTDTHENILCVSNFGRIFSIKVYQLPESSRFSLGKPIVNFLSLKDGEKITSIFSLKNFKKGNYILIATLMGLIKKISMDFLTKARKSGIIIINLNKRDEVIAMDSVKKRSEIILFTSSAKAIRFSENSVRLTGRKSMGVMGVKIQKDEKLVSMIIVEKDKDILTITENGYGNRTKESEYLKKSRFIRGVSVIKNDERNGKIVGAIQVERKDQVVIFTNYGILIRILVKDISVFKRNTKGIILIRKINDQVVSGIYRVSSI
ncbi:DNA gyrase subunit A [Candidatus Riesia pediculicola]|uniref:DNA gyrase subunit A n=1 Tax=Riesia pediculicola (strain USDA) TaxID=515618 RepID=D4G7N6_RIEPU|nr:DNA gyrase subunit A [Candidatus Riesia pediculicola]ADD79918.1 DNA gyrase, A subunit [Candidatus Riesia pediculicola USDA]ARC53612.1 DNA gyrase subunit A [Candidatus Riesia pediculicola]QOJ86264.1 DNA gyrase subunit A [Candidatus Riesia pediculicola]